MPDYLRSVKVNPTHLCRIHVTFQQALSFENPRRAMNITICSISGELLAFSGVCGGERERSLASNDKACSNVEIEAIY